MKLSDQERARVIEVAKTWMRTPYHHQACVKGAGVDCAMFPLAVYRECGIISEDFQTPEYSTQWHLHHSEELYLQAIDKVAAPKLSGDPEPADFVIWKFGRTFSHGAIVIKWPLVIHSYIPHGVTLADASNDAQLIDREFKVFEIHKGQK